MSSVADDYSFLNLPFWDWQKGYRVEWIGESRYRARTLKQLGVNVILEDVRDIGEFQGIETLEDFEEAYVDPFVSPVPRMRQRLELLAQALSAKLESNAFTGSGGVLEVIVRPSPKYCGLSWTVAQMAAIAKNKLQGFDIPGRLIEGTNIDSLFMFYQGMPYQQCLVCGAYLDQTQPNKKDELWFCHQESCSWAPEYHSEGCCFLKWRRLKQRVIKRLRYQQEKQDAIDILLETCEQLLSQNISIQNPIRAKYDDKTRWEMVQNSPRPDTSSGFVRFGDHLT